jgi:hypothetical protein
VIPHHPQFAEKNMSIAFFLQVFLAIPSDAVHTYDDLEDRQAETSLVESDPEAAEKAMKKVRGYLVQ